MSKITFAYDEGDFTDSNLVQNISSAIQHDQSNFSNSLMVGRGNLTSTTRHDVSGQTANVTSQVKYNTTGAPVANIDPLGRTVRISYADAFNDNQNRNTFAYPTKLTDPANNYSEVKYRFDTGANVWAKSPAPAGNTNGKETARIYDSLGRVQKETIVNSGAYTRYEYPLNQIQSKVFSTVIDTNNNGADANDEVYSESWTDGAGRTLRVRTEHPNSTGGWSGTLAEYDILGQVKRSSVPTEINTNYEPSGDDQTRGWLWTSAEYDWKGRVTREINTDGTDRLMNYDGCGCAGGQVTTVQSESVPRDDIPNQTARRTQKIYADILGRSYKTEVLNWDNSVYSTIKTKYNGRDQAIEAKHFNGLETSSVFQTTTASFDGHGRLKTSHKPEQDGGKFDFYEYRTDDQLDYKLDARGARTSFSYNNLGLLNSISYSVPANSDLYAPPSITFGYDLLGNRIWMQDGLGRIDYEYDELSKLKNETRQFAVNLTDAPTSPNGFRFAYTYNLGGGLKTVDYPDGTTIGYSYDKTGRTETVSGQNDGQPISFIGNVDYRAWNGLKNVEFGTDNNSQFSYNNRLQPDTEVYTGKRELNGGTVPRVMINNKYNYNADGSIKYIEDLRPENNQFRQHDRLSRYDHLGRLTSERSGREILGSPQTDDFIKYKYNQSFDIWGNTKSESAEQALDIGAEGITRNYNYFNNRMVGGTTPNDGVMPASQYDADGRQTKVYTGGYMDYKYDAAGFLINQKTTTAHQTEQDLYYDGDGRQSRAKDVMKRNYTNEQGQLMMRKTTLTRYTVGSALLGEGLIYHSSLTQEYENVNQPPVSQITEKDTMTYIYGMGQKIAVIKKSESSFSPGVVTKRTKFEYDAAFRSKEITSDYTNLATTNGVSIGKTQSSRGLPLERIQPGASSERGLGVGGRWTGNDVMSNGGALTDSFVSHLQ